MKKATLENVQARLGEYIETSARQPLLILRDGEPVAVLVGLRRNEKRTPAKLRDVLRQAWQEYEQHGGVSHEQAWADLAKETPANKKPARKG